MLDTLGGVYQSVALSPGGQILSYMSPDKNQLILIFALEIGVPNYLIPETQKEKTLISCDTDYGNSY